MTPAVKIVPKNEVLVMLKVEMCAFKSTALTCEKLLFPYQILSIKTHATHLRKLLPVKDQN